MKELKIFKGRGAEILTVFSRHNFYVNGFTPEEMRTTLEDLGPTYVKIGQIMSSRSDMLPEAYCRELQKLRSEVRPMQADIARRVIEEETGRTIADLFTEFRDEPLGSASIAQAHYAVLKDGTPVVIKVQRPHVGEMMRRDFVMLNKLADAAGVVTEAASDTGMVDLKSVIAELERVTNEELDFRVEAANTRLFREKCIEDDSVISCPRVIDSLSTEKILTLTYVDGYSIQDRERVIAEGGDCAKIGKIIVESYMHQVLDVGIFHADPHQGNIMISKGVPCWIDFGMIGRISPGQADILQDMVFALAQKDAEALTNTALSMGIASGEVNKAQLNDDIQGMIDLYASVRRLSDLDIGRIMTEFAALLVKNHMTVPSEYTMLMRSMVTIEGVLEQFCPELNLFDFLSRKILSRARENLDVREKLKEAAESMAAAGMRTVRLPGIAFDALRSLVRGRVKVNIELTGYEELWKRLHDTVLNVILAIFSSVLFLGACRLAVMDLEPKVRDIPAVAFLAFAASVALGIYTVQKMARKNK